MALAFFKFLFVNLGFIFLIFYMVISSEMKKIKQQWPLYRCNPTYMFLADNIAENYKYCLGKTSQISFDKYSLDLSGLQTKGFKSQYTSNENLKETIKANNSFGDGVSLSLTDFVTKSGKISTIGTLFTAQFTDITDKLLKVVGALSSTLTSGISGVGVLNNEFSKYSGFIERLGLL